MASTGSRDRTRVLHWTTDAPASRQLQRDGYHVLTYQRLAVAVVSARPNGSVRSSLKNPATGLLSIYAKHARVAVLGVPSRRVEELRIIYGYILEPAFRSGCSLLISAECDLQSLSPKEFIDPEWRCPYTLERLWYLASIYTVPAQVEVPDPVSRWRRLANLVSRRGDSRPRPVPHLDPEQNAAICAGDGVVQVIAPAGSGKTTVLVERVRELCRRGTPANRILCSTFNRDACLEMSARLAKVGLEDTNVRSFHGLGLSILKEEGLLRESIGTLEIPRWQELAERAGAADPGCGKFDAAAAQDAVGIFKLVLMISPRTAWERAADQGPRERVKARVYVLYQRLLRQKGMLDFDDLISKSIALLQDDSHIRRRWQARFERVLVDEYQDIEPAQALLIGLLAAPQDSLFCVGDEDQCIYAWRRASVQRVIDLDQVYPGLERFPLIRNYRCGRAITKASRRLIGHNRIRFRKPLKTGIKEPGHIRVWPQADPGRGAAFVARLLQETVPGQVAVLARTGQLLADVVEASRYVFDAGESLGGVELATVHGAKGREWDRVILFGADQGRFPLARAVRSGDKGDEESGLEDERRLFYVALTRAKLQLDIVFSAEKPSQFLKEAGIRTSRGGRWL
ncbi:MAG: ATP-dependent helicase [Gemmatimonadales bacterium]|nr:ATP-dependent helicase [Gemmatimonadales bacterium]